MSLQEYLFSRDVLAELEQVPSNLSAQELSGRLQGLKIQAVVCAGLGEQRRAALRGAPYQVLELKQLSPRHIYKALSALA